MPHEGYDITGLDEFGNEEIVSLAEVEKLHIKKVLNHHDWNREYSARALGISQKTLYSKILKYGLK